jgi:hypothetical protein
MKFRLFLATLLVCLSYRSNLAAQAVAGTSGAPPKFFLIVRETLKTGRAALENAIEVDSMHTCVRMKCPNTYLAATTVTGRGQTWWFTPFDSYAEFEKVNAAYGQNPALASEIARMVERKADLLLGPPDVVIVEYQSDLSQNAGSNFSHAHYLSITTVRVAPGHDGEFEQLHKIESTAHERLGLKCSHLVYQVVSGAPDHEYLVITPLQSVAAAEQEPVLHGQRQERLFDEKNLAAVRQLSGAAIVGSETDLFTPNPAWSYLPNSWIAADPDLWGAAGVRNQ